MNNIFINMQINPGLTVFMFSSSPQLREEFFGEGGSSPPSI